jgi:hypothetical protein
MSEQQKSCICDCSHCNNRDLTFISFINFDCKETTLGVAVEWRDCVEIYFAKCPHSRFKSLLAFESPILIYRRIRDTDLSYFIFD